MTDLEKRLEWLQTHRALIKADLDAVLKEVTRLKAENEQLRAALKIEPKP